MELLIKNGTIINADRTVKADIFLKNGKIAFIRANIDIPENVKVLNAVGKFLIPGGIDPHVHMHLPVPGGFSSDNFYTGSRAAIFGGTTTLLDFVTPYKSQSLVEALHQRKNEALESITDYSFHVSPVDWHHGIEEEIAQCIAEGISSFKVYLAYLDTVGLNSDVFERVLKTVGRLGGMVTIHCETGKEIEEKRTEFYDKGFNKPSYHPLSRPPEAEANAVKSAIALAGQYNCPIYIVHVSTKESLKYIEQSKNAGQAVFAETCPQYLLLEDSMYQGSFEDTSPYVMSPPLRKKEDNDALWNAINSGIIDTVGTDHCPFTLEQKYKGKDDFRKIPNGAGGVEHRLELLYTYGVLNDKISQIKWVELCSTKPAELFGLKSKGKIAVGMDADIVIWDPHAENVISSQTHHQNTNTNIYEGFKTKGKAETVIRNGEMVIENSKILPELSKGSFIRR
jgi:dihydropyrimidinase